MRNNRDELWHLFAGADVEPTLTVVRNDIVKGSPENLWEEMVHELAGQVGAYLPEIRDQLVPAFSTTGPRERMAFELALLEVVLPFYLYQFMAICGIPEVTLEGAPDDWKLLRERVHYLRRFEIDWWLDRLDAVCEGFVQAAEGNPDPEHWQGIYRKDPACGGTEFDGWIGHLVPYIRGELSNRFDKRNPLLFGGDEPVKLAALPTPLSRVPFTLSRRDAVHRDHRMEFLSGMVGVEQHSLTLRPKIGWAVRELTPMERVGKELQDARPALGEAAMSAQYQRLDVLPRPPHALKQFYAACNGGRVGGADGAPAYEFLPMELIEPRPVNVPQSLVRGEYTVRAHLAPFCRMAGGSIAALLLGFGYEHHGAVVVIPPGGTWGRELLLVADRLETFLDNAFACQSQPYFTRPEFETKRIEAWE